MNRHFKSNGKFLLTGEYLVLKGAVALALPLKLGQSLDVETLECNENRVYWEAFIKTMDNELQTTEHKYKNWFKVVLNKSDLSVIDTDDKEKAERLSDILTKAKALNNDIFDISHDYRFCTLLDFSPQWGLGSSSTLINNISEWGKINPYKLLDTTFKGSGYDIACAKAECPIFYKINERQSMANESSIASFDPPFKDNLYFVYLGHKQNSAKEVKAFLDKNRDYSEEIKNISEISRLLPNIDKLNDFCRLINTHEDIIGRCIGRQAIRNDFSDFEGTVKSLGAWGGDFIMAATEWNENKVKKYFEDKRLNVIIKYQDIVMDNSQFIMHNS